MTTPTAIPDLTGINAKISDVLIAAQEETPSSTSTVTTGIVSMTPEEASPRLDDLKIRVEKLEAQMAKLAGGLGTIASVAESTKPKTIQSIMRGGRRKTRKRKTNRK